jgi:calcineurin-like phosphoesterase family protein
MTNTIPKQTLVISDPHFGHVGVTKFLRADGSKLRPWDNVEEMNEVLVDNWNKAVRPFDRVYLLGDATMNRKALPIFSRLNGDKVLIKGNHDTGKLGDYTPYFRDIRSCVVRHDMILTHIPVHEMELDRFKFNVHGHLHDHIVMKDGAPDPRYLCVSVEQIDYTPINMDKLIHIAKLLSTRLD